MSEITIRTSKPRTEGGDLSDVLISYTVEAIDESGRILHTDSLWLSSKGVQQDPAEVAKHVEEATTAWAEANAEQIDAGARRLAEKAQEIAVAQPLLDAIRDAPDVVKSRAEIGLAEVVGESDVAPAKVKR